MQQIAYLHAMGFKRDLSGPQLVLNIQSLFLPAQGHWLTTHFLGWENNLNYYSWDIGIIPLFVVMLSIFLGLLKYGFKDSYKRKVIIALISMMALALFLGFGPKFGLVIEDKNYSPYEFLYSIIPGLKFIRNPARFIKFFIFAMAVLSGLSLAHIRSRIKTRSGKLAVTAGLFMLLFAEMWAMPLALVFPEDQMNKHAGATSWLRDNARGGLVLELPMPQRLWPIDLELDAEAMHRMLKHRNPIVNGHASFGPLPFKQLRKALVVDPAGAGQRYLKAYGVRYVLLHKDRMTNEQRISLQKTLGDNIVYSDSQHDIYLLAQRITDLDIREFLPLKAKFKDYPEIGNIYSLHLIKAPLEAILIMPQPDWWLDLSWDSPSGERKTKKVRILGSVILDREESCLYFQLINFPKGAKQAEARLVSSEEVSELAFKKGPASKKLKCIRDYLTP
jgi:hypothetical protein